MYKKVTNKIKAMQNIAFLSKAKVSRFIHEGETRDSKTNLIALMEFFKNIEKECERGNYKKAVLNAKRACEEAVSRAERAKENGGYQLAGDLRDIAMNLARPTGWLINAIDEGVNLDEQVSEVRVSVDGGLAKDKILEQEAEKDQ